MSSSRIMRSVLTMGLASIIINPLAGQEPDLAVTDATHVTVTGRASRHGEQLRMAYPGIEIRVRFRGAAIRLTGEVLDGDSWFNVWIDGEPRPHMHFPKGAIEWTIATNLDPEAEHVLRLIRRNEAWQGVVQLAGFSLPEGGEFLEAAPARERRILAIGDSITCGDRAEFMPPYGAEGGHTTNAEAGYAWQLAKRFQADLQLVSYGGKGIVRDWSGDRSQLRAEEFFERSLPDDPSSRWDHARFSPELVMICLGTNDFAEGILDEEEYVPAYVRLVERVHEIHPEAKVLLISSPMLGNYAPEKNEALERYLDAVKAHFDGEGKRFVSVHRIRPAAGSIWDAHPTAPQHAAMAEELVDPVASLTGWAVE